MRLAVMASCFIYVSLFGLLQAILAPKTSRRIHVGMQPNRHLGLPLVAVSIVMLYVAQVTMMDDDVSAFKVLRITGIVVVVGGLGLSLWAQKVLGDNWIGGVGLRRNHNLVTRGPYRWVRHPMYSGIFVSTIGLGLITMNLFYGASMILAALYLAIRIPQEEALLRKQFRKAHERYAARTGMLIPRIRRQ